MKLDITSIDFAKGGGLVPIIVQDTQTNEILTLAYANIEALKKTQETSKSWFYSRSRKKLWMKGETSGNIQHVKDILVDCDSDALVYRVTPTGPACHTGKPTCFHNTLQGQDSV